MSTCTKFYTWPHHTVTWLYDLVSLHILLIYDREGIYIIIEAYLLAAGPATLPDDLPFPLDATAILPLK